MLTLMPCTGYFNQSQKQVVFLALMIVNISLQALSAKASISIANSLAFVYFMLLCGLHADVFYLNSSLSWESGYRATGSISVLHGTSRGRTST